MARFGYARVSSTDQDLDIQLAKLEAEGCDPIRAEKVSGGSRDGRTELATLLSFLRSGDELVVTRLDRLGRPDVSSSSNPPARCRSIARSPVRWARPVRLPGG